VRFSVTDRGPRLSAAGWAIGLGAVVLYAAGAALGYPELRVLAVSGGAAILLAALFVAVRPRLRVIRSVEPSRVTVGAPALATLTVRNLARLPSPGFVAVDRLAAHTVEVPVRSVARGGSRVIRYPLAPPRRGRYEVGPLTIDRRDPIGLLRRAQRHALPEVLWVHPRIHAMAPFPVGTQLDHEGRVTESSPRGSVTFSGVREYVPGDDPRQVHWRSTARMGTLMVKEHVDTSKPTTTVVLDTRARLWDAASGGGPDFEQAVEVAASVVAAAQRAGRPAALHLPGEDPAGAPGASGPLDRLVAVMPALVGGVEQILGTVERAAAGGALVVITAAPEPGFVTRLAGQRRFAPVVLVDIAATGPVAATRRARVVVVRAASARDVAGAWNQVVAGRPG
jgi:uncharacterized protein (DUF58 family)